MRFATTTFGHWWILVMSGIVAILFGLAAVLWPGLTLFVFVVLFGVYAIVYGLVELIAAAGALSTNTPWWPRLLLGLLSIGAGVLAFVYPDTTGVALLYIIAFWAIAVGIMQLVLAFATNTLSPAIVGVIAILFGLLLVSNPGRGALALVVLIGSFAIVFGVVQVIGAFGAAFNISSHKQGTSA